MMNFPASAKNNVQIAGTKKPRSPNGLRGRWQERPHDPAGRGRDLAGERVGYAAGERAMARSVKLAQADELLPMLLGLKHLAGRCRLPRTDNGDQAAPNGESSWMSFLPRSRANAPVAVQVRPGVSDVRLATLAQEVRWKPCRAARRRMAADKACCWDSATSPRRTRSPPAATPWRDRRVVGETNVILAHKWMSLPKGPAVERF